MKRLFTSMVVGFAFIIGAHIPSSGHDWPGVALAMKFVLFIIGYMLMDIYGRNYLKWINNE